MSFLDRFRKRTEDEASRIARLSKTGRMVDGNIIDAVSDNDGRITPGDLHLRACRSSVRILPSAQRATATTLSRLRPRKTDRRALRSTQTRKFNCGLISRVIRVHPWLIYTDVSCFAKFDRQSGRNRHSHHSHLPRAGRQGGGDLFGSRRREPARAHG